MIAAIEQNTINEERLPSVALDFESQQQPVAASKLRPQRGEFGPYSETLGQAMHSIIIVSHSNHVGKL
jgi:hypothetical protein